MGGKKTNSVCILSQSTYWLREENKLSIGVPAVLQQLASSIHVVVEGVLALVGSASYALLFSFDC